MPRVPPVKVSIIFGTALVDIKGLKTGLICLQIALISANWRLPKLPEVDNGVKGVRPKVTETESHGVKGGASLPEKVGYIKLSRRRNGPFLAQTTSE